MIINMETTLSRNFVSFNEEKHDLCNYNVLFGIDRLIRNGFIPDSKLINELLYLKDDTVYNNLIDVLLRDRNGKFLKTTFATKENILEEGCEILDFVEQMNEYTNTYFNFSYFNIISGRFIVNEISEDLKKDFNFLSYKTIEEFTDYAERMVYMPIVFGESQKNIIYTALAENLFKIDKPIKVKENLFMLHYYIEDFTSYLTTVNDVMRYAIYCSNGNIRIDNSFREFDLTTSERKVIMRSLNKISYANAFNDMYAKRDLWIALGKHIFAASPKYKTKNASRLFINLRNKTDKNLRNNHILGEARKSNFKLYIELLSKKPGLLMRSLDEILRKASKSEFKYLIELIKNTELNNKLLLSQINRLKWRSQHEVGLRVIHNGLKLVTIDKPLEKLKESRVKRIVSVFEDKIREDLVKEELFNFTDIKLDKKLKKYVLPTELRDSSETDSGEVYTPGSRIKLPEDVKFVRMFVAWGTPGDYDENRMEHFDIDLSVAAIHNEDGESKYSRIAFYNQKNYYAIHSGDRTSCHNFNPEKDELLVAEYIDIDINLAKENFVENISTLNYIYHGEDFDKVHAYAGIMFLNERQVTSDQINLKKAFISFKLNGNFQSQVPFSLDVVNNELIIIDQYYKANSGSTIDGMMRNVFQFKEKYLLACEKQYNVYDFIKMYCEEHEIEINESSENVIDIQYVSDNLESIVSLI